LKSSNTRIIIRSILLALTLLLAAVLFLEMQSYMASLLVAVIAIVQVVLIISDQNKTNRQLSVFFDSVKFEDYNVSTKYTSQGRTYGELGATLDSLGMQFKAIREDKESQFQFNQNILHNVGAGIIAFDASGKVEFSNKLFHSMMHVPYCDDLKKVSQFNDELTGKLRGVEPRRKLIFKQETNGLSQHFLLTSSEFVVNGRGIKLVVIQNIQPTIDQTEMEAWQKLIRVLTHEIMNSITPISSLSATALTMVASTGNDQQLDDEQITDLREALHTINRRCDGLVTFVQQYRSLTSIPQPVFSVIAIEELFLRVGLLFRTEYSTNNIEFVKEIQGTNLELVADASLIEQVIINLLKNAIHAVENKPNAKITLSARETELERIEIQVSDNGCGILPDVVDKVFIPFFTTKPSGSGIGLSLSKQIMLMHGGNITVTSTPKRGTDFVLRF